MNVYLLQNELYSLGEKQPSFISEKKRIEINVED